MLNQMGIAFQQEKWTTVAHLLRPQGRKGELLADLHTDFPERFTSDPKVFLAPPGYKGEASSAREAEVTSHFLPVGRNQGRIVLAFAGVNSISEAEQLNGLDVVIPSEARVELEAESEYIDDLVGCTVYDGDRAIGQVTGIDFPATADGSRRHAEAAPLLNVETPGGDEVLIPYVQAFLLKVDTSARRIEMTLPEGLIDLNAKS